MLKYLLFLSLLPLTAAATAQSAVETSGEGIEFSEKKFDALLAQARSEDRLIFIDAYTTWCGPCKMMTARVFPDPEVGAVYNERFINAKFDMEKGEGPELARRYAVAAYPTYLFVNGEGELVHKGLGFIPKPALLELADVAVSDRSLGAMAGRYEAGERDGTFMREYAEVLNNSRMQQRADEVVDAYLDEQDDWSTPDNLQLILSNPGGPGDRRMAYLVEHAETIDAMTGPGSAARAVEGVLVNGYHQQNRRRSMAAPEKIAPYLDRHAGALAERLKLHYRMLYHDRARNEEEYLQAALAYAEQYTSNDFAELNGMAWNFFERTDDPELLAKATEWAERSVEIYPYYPNLDTLAWLYHKTGRQEEAEATAHRAIEAARDSGVDYSETEKIFQ